MLSQVIFSLIENSYEILAWILQFEIWSQKSGIGDLIATTSEYDNADNKDYDNSVESDFGISASIPSTSTTTTTTTTISAATIGEENVYDQIAESSTNASFNTTEMMPFYDEIIRYSDTQNIFMLLTNDNDYYDYYDYYDYDGEDHSYIMHIRSDYASFFDYDANSNYIATTLGYDTNSTMIAPMRPFWKFKPLSRQQQQLHLPQPLQLLHLPQLLHLLRL